MSDPPDFEAFKEQDRLAMFKEHPLVTSPDGRIKISYESHEIRNGQWINIPHMYEIESGRILFKPSSSMVDGQHEWAQDGTFTLCLREFPDGALGLILEFDIANMTVRLQGEEQWSPIEKGRAIANREFSRIKKARREAYDAEMGQSSTWRRVKEVLGKVFDVVSMTLFVLLIVISAAEALGLSLIHI